MAVEWKQLEQYARGVAPKREQGKWSKSGAFKGGESPLFSERLGEKIKPSPELIRKEVERKLTEWDLLPIGERIARMRELRKAIDEHPLMRAADRASRRRVKATIKGNLDEHIRKAEETLGDMKRVFRHWGVKLKKVGIREEDISHPSNALISRKTEEADIERSIFSSPTIAEWYGRLDEHRDEKDRVQLDRKSVV
jgi:hypothetical protein